MQTMDAQLNIRLPAYVMEAMESAASKRRLRLSAYVRQTVLARLIVEGAVTREQIEGSETNDGVAAMAGQEPDFGPGHWRHEWLRKWGLV